MKAHIPKMKKYFLSLLCLLTLVAVLSAQTKPAEKLNVLFLAVDDLNTQVGWSEFSFYFGTELSRRGGRMPRKLD